MTAFIVLSVNFAFCDVIYDDVIIQKTKTQRHREFLVSFCLTVTITGL